MAQPGEGGARSGTPSALSGLRVLNLGSSLSAAWCARTLADYGAEATIVEPPGGAALRRLGPHGPEGESIPAAYALANQRSLVLDLAIEADRAALRDLALESDIVIESRAPGVLEDAGASFEELRGERPGLILAALTPHGLTGPRAGQPGNDLTAFARSGWAAINGRAGEPPLKGARYVASLYAGLTGAAALLAALRERAASGRGQLVDLAETDALATTFASVAAHAQYQGELDQRNVVWFRDPLRGPLPAADGYFHIMLGRSDFFRLALHILELPELAEDERFDSRAARLELADEWVPAVWERVAAREKIELFEALTTARVVAGPVLDTAELAANEHLEARGFFVRPEGGGPRMPGPAARLSATPPRLRRAAPEPGANGSPVPGEERERRAATPPPTGRARSRPLEGLRALALTQVWAGAHCAQHLALLGAEVIKVEARRRPDTWRGGYEMPILSALRDRPTAQRGWNCHPSFNSGNLNQLGLTLDLQRPAGIRLLRRLLRSTDIVVENFTPRVLGSLGIGYEAMREERPDIILCSISGFGASGPYRDRPSNGGTIEPASGMSSLLGFPGGPPRNSGATFPDPLAAMTAVAAILAALEHRARSGGGQHIDVSMQEATLALVGDAALEHELTGRTPGPQGNRHPDHAPHGVYPASGEDRWVALAAEGDAQWARLCEVADHPGWLTDERYATGAARKANEDALDGAIADWTRGQPRDELAERLAAAGLPAAPVLNPGELPSDTSFGERGVVAEVEHPEAGAWPYVVVPYRLTETPLRVTAPAPCLGEHAAEVLARLAGVDAAAYEELVRLGISGEDPPE
ncbi:MAG: CoA transferase [Chloroflexi bacterium]|nr:CoA transferase [Chloroflexota bacterium]